MTLRLWNMLWTLEWRYGVGLDIEICDSRPVVVTKPSGKEVYMPFDGMILSFPFFLISIGNVWIEE